MSELTEEVQFRAGICEVDLKDMTFEVELIDGPTIEAPLSDQHFETIMEAVRGYRAGARVAIQGIGKQDPKTGRLIGLDSVEQVSLLEPLDVPTRLDELKALRDGWLDGEGQAPSHDGLDWLAQCFANQFPADLALPRIYPTAEGGVQAEWSMPPWDATLEIDLDRHIGEWHRLNLETGIVDSGPVNLDDSKDWDVLAERVRTLTMTAA